MTTIAGDTWLTLNQRELASAIDQVRRALEGHLGAPTSGEQASSCASGDGAAAAPTALHTVGEAFGLSPFERAVLVLAAAVELDGRVGELCASARGTTGWAEATFGLALAALDEPHWSALAPSSPLRRWELVHLTGTSLTTSAVRIDERVLHHLVGAGSAGDGLDGLAVTHAAPADLPRSQRAAAAQLAARWRATDAHAPVANLTGRSPRAKLAVAATAAGDLGAGLLVIDGRCLPSDAHELDRLARLVEREVVLSASAVLVDADELDDPERLRAASLLVERVAAPVAIATRERIALRDRGSVAIAVERPTSDEQWRLWSAHVDDPEVVDALVGQFDLDAGVIGDVAGTIELAAPGVTDDGPGLPAPWWDACRDHVRPHLGGLAQRVESAAAWDDIVLPPAQLDLLHQIVLDVQHRFTVYERWGMHRGRRRGLGTTALFSGPSGTGKTLAAEVLANELGLDVYRIDLAAVVSKYIGETEKNLRQVFDEADRGGVVLLFDEADALFGKRTEVSDSHDRYANTEIAYLLQRMEEHRGLAILTTNLRDALDRAFLRRLRFVIEFPFPLADQRAAIWRQAFPATTPTDDLDLARLAELNLSGGSIHNVATAAAFLAAGDGGRVGMHHVIDATRVECAKLDLPLGLSLNGTKR